MFTYLRLLDETAALPKENTGVIGATAFGRVIPFVRVGEGEPKIIVTGGIHARENVTVGLVLAQAKHALRTLKRGTAYFLPMLNPDGAALIELGASAFGKRGEALLAINGGSADFSLWKANAAGVDLNVNFPAGWGEGRRNVRRPAPSDNIGPFPASEPETRALMRFTLRVKPASTISYHAKGRELYWYFRQDAASARRDEKMAARINEKLGYRLGAAETDSAGGYKDWCIARLNIPAFTAEIVSDALSHPLPDDALTKAEIAANIDVAERMIRYLTEVKP